MTQKKAERYFNEHPEKAAKYCSERFPLKPSTIVEFVQVDSAGYEQAYNELLTYADSLLDKMRKDTPSVIVGGYWQGRNEAIGDGVQMRFAAKTNIDSLRTAIERKIRKSLRPCIDSVKIITKIVPDSAKVFYLESVIKKQMMDLEFQKDKTHRNGKQRNWCILIILILLGWIFRKRLLGLIAPVTKFWPFLIILSLSFCSPSEYIETEFENVRIIKIDTVPRFGEDKLEIQLRSDRGITYTSYASIKHVFVLGTNYLMVVRK